ncbi:hypothetical protein V2P20_16655 [Methylobacter sp. Wu1]|uniref:hypothetical protein n=1 Tax=Methylobacter sp. Wu1 TaxID=3119359 RepID=UPI002F941878
MASTTLCVAEAASSSASLKNPNHAFTEAVLVEVIEFSLTGSLRSLLNNVPVSQATIPNS